MELSPCGWYLPMVSPTIRAHLRCGLSGPLFNSIIAYKIRRWTGFKPSLTSGKALDTITLRHKPFHYVCRMVGRIVLHNEDMKNFFQGKHVSYYILYVFLLVVSRNDYYTVRSLHLILISFSINYDTLCPFLFLLLFQTVDKRPFHWNRIAETISWNAVLFHPNGVSSNPCLDCISRKRICSLKYGCRSIRISGKISELFCSA